MAWLRSRWVEFQFPSAGLCPAAVSKRVTSVSQRERVIHKVLSELWAPHLVAFTTHTSRRRPVNHRSNRSSWWASVPQLLGAGAVWRRSQRTEKRTLPPAKLKKKKVPTNSASSTFALPSRNGPDQDDVAYFQSWSRSVFFFFFCWVRSWITVHQSGREAPGQSPCRRVGYD